MPVLDHRPAGDGGSDPERTKWGEGATWDVDLGDTFVGCCPQPVPGEAPAPPLLGPAARAPARGRSRSCSRSSTAIGASLATEAQAHKVSGQHVIVHLSCTKVTFLMLGFPEGVTNEVHPKVKVERKSRSTTTRARSDFYGSIAEFEVPVEIPATGEYLIQAGATWNTNGIIGESTTTKTEATVHRHRPAAFSIEKEQRLAGEAAYTSNELQGKVGADRSNTTSSSKTPAPKR